MKKIILSIICLIVLVFGSLPVMAADEYNYNNAPYLHIVETKYEPYPVEPGGYFDLWLNVQNKGREASNLVFKLDPQFPFSLDPNENAERIFGNILSGQTILVHYKIRVSPDAVEGINKLKYLFKSSNVENWNEATLDVMIRTHDVVLAVTKVETNPEKLRPGKAGLVEIVIKNMADSLVKDLKVKLDLTDIPIAPIGSTNEKMYKNLDSDDEIAVRFSVMPEPDVNADLYKIPLMLEYSDEVGNTYTRENTISVIVGDLPDLTTTIESSTIHQSNSLGEVAIKFVNKGLTEVKFLNVQLKSSTGYTIVSPQDVYLGNIDSDDYETAEFKIYVDKAGEEVKLPLTLEYMDSNNDQYSRTVVLSMPLYNSKEAKKLGLAPSKGSGGFVVFVIIIILGVWGYRKWRKSRKKNK